MSKLVAVLFVLVVASNVLAQIGGGSATFGKGQQRDDPRTLELAKRAQSRDEGRYLEASVLMNAEADEYIALFAVSQEGKTLDEARSKMDSAVASFTDHLKELGVKKGDSSVDFVSQNRIYGFEDAGAALAKEIVVGFEVKKNVAIRYTDKAMLDRLVAAASKSGIFDLVKVDYVIRDPAPIRAKLLQEAAKVLKRKADEQEQFLGFRLGQVTAMSTPMFSTYFPSELYDSYVAQESEAFEGYRPNQIVQRARKPRTFYFNGLNGKDFDTVVNPSNTDPTVQFTVFVRAKY